MKKRILSIVLSLVMLVSLLPTTALAADNNPHTGGGHDGWTVWDGSNIETSGNYYLNSTVYSATNTYILIGLIGSSTEAINVTLCLNGNTLNLGNHLRIVNATVNLCDCSSEQTGKIVGSDASGVNHTIFQDGSNQTILNLYGGTISGKSSCGAVCVNGSNHTFNMYGGKITNVNSSSSNTGAVYVANGGFNMYGGEISGCRGKCSGVYAFGTATVTMEDGAAIKNNTSDSHGGGVYISGGTFTMKGGSITGNTADNGGGVYVSGGSFKMTGGRPVIAGNKKDTADNNVYLSSGKVITVTGELTEGAQIGVTTNSPGTFAQPDGTNVNSAAPYAGYFESDNDSYIVQPSGNNLALVVPHVHGNWTFSYDACSNRITANCGEDGCPLPGSKAESKISIRTAIPYSSNYECPVEIANLNVGNDWDNAGLPKPEVKDKGLTKGLNGTATITVDGKEVCTVSYTLVKGTLTAKDFDYTAPTDLTYNGSAKEATVVAQNTPTLKDKVGAVTVVYYDESGNPVNGKPVNAGKYTVKINVAESTYYKAVENLVIWTFEINQKDISNGDITVSNIPNQTYTGEQIKPEARDVTMTYNGMTLEPGKDFELTGYGGNKEVGAGTGTVTITGKGNYAGTKAATFNIVYATMDAAEMLDWTTGENSWFNLNEGTRPIYTPKTGYTASLMADGTYGPGALDFSDEDEGENVFQTVYVKDSESKVYQVTLSYKYDKSAPTVDNVTGNPTAWTRENAEISFTTGDGLSEVNTVVVACDDGEDVTYDTDSFTADRNGTYTITVTDNAGNVKTATVEVTMIDKTAPVVEAWYSGGANTGAADGWKTDATCNVTIDEANLDKWEYTLDGGETWLYGDNTKKFAIPGDGVHSVLVRATDSAGNVTTYDATDVKVDATAPDAPAVTAKVGEDNYASGEYNTGDVEFTLTGGEDVTSGFKTYQYKIGDGEWEDIEGDTYTHTVSTTEEGMTYEFRAVDNAGNVSSDAEFTVKKAFPLRFNANGGTGEMANDYVYVGGAIVIPECVFTRTGYTFAGWNTAADGSGTAYLVDETLSDIRENVGGGFDLYAQWTVNKYPITFNAGEGTFTDGGKETTIEVEFGTVPTAPEMPARAGYSFAAWTPELSAVGVDGATYTATYTPNDVSYNVEIYTMDTDGEYGEPAIEAKTAKTDSIVSVTPEAKDGFTVDTVESVLSDTVEADGSTVLEVYYKRNQYDFTIVVDSVDETKTYYYGQVVTVPEAPTKEAYTFTGWDVEIPATMPSNDLTVTAQWTIDQYTITFNTDDGTAFDAITQDYNTAVAAPAAPTKTGYTFAGWDKEIPATMPAEDMTITATWIANTYKVVFDANGGNGEMADQSFTYDVAQELTANTFTRDGYKFMGWAESADGTGVYSDKQSVRNLTDAANGVLTIYAIWNSEPVYDITGRVGQETEGDGARGWVEGAIVQLKQGNTVLFTKTTDDYGQYEFHAPAGTYNIVAEKDGKTITRLIVVSDHDEAVDTIHLPYQNVSSELSITEGTPDIVVGGLDEEVVETNPNATSHETHITLSMTVKQEEDITDDSAPIDAELKTEQEEIKEEAGSQSENLTFFTIDLSKITTTNQVAGKPEEVTNTANLLEIIIPFETSGRMSFRVYRYHGSDVDVLTTTANGDGEHIEVGDDEITIHARKFSTYAIGYTDPESYDPPDVTVHTCTSKCDVCGGCEDAACTESACKDKCLLLGMNFTDVAEGKWYTEAVEYVYHHNMMEGIGNNLFDPSGTTSRAMIVTILWRLEGEPVVNHLMDFEDVPSEMWYTEAVRWAASEKIVEGWNGKFDPMGDITREQFATILWRYAKYKGYDVSVGEDTNILSYNDALYISEYAISAMQWACGAGIMEGDGVYLTPRADATRAQAAALFQRFCENVAEK